MKGAKILVLGLSYKEDIDDDRESPSYEIIEILQEKGALVSYCDPFFPVARPGRKHDIRMESTDCSAEAFGRYDAVVLSTGHKQFQDPALYSHARLIIDTRNAVRLPEGALGRVVKA